jgi:hypothetical protein
MRTHIPLAAAVIVAAWAGSAPATETIEGAGKISVPDSLQRGTARALGMAGAYVGVAEGTDALQWNPAGLVSVGSAETGWHHATGIDDRFDETLISGTRVGSIGSVAAAGDYDNYGSFERRDETGNPAGKYDAGLAAATIGWGGPVIEGLSVGAALRASRQVLADEAFNSAAVDIGALWRLDRGVSVGAAVANLGSGGSGFSMATGFRAGASWMLKPFGPNRLLVAVAGEFTPKGTQSVAAGAEDRLFGRLAVRAGWRQPLSAQHLSGLTGLTAGIGASLGSLTVDYAFLPAGDLGDVHRISLTYRRAAGGGS